MLEAIIALAVTAILLGNIAMVQRATGDAYESSVFGSNLQDQADTTMDRIALALMSTDFESLDEVMAAPGFVSAIDYEVVADVEDGEPIVGTPERIEFDLGNSRIVWKRDPGAADEMSVVWTKHVSDMLEGELPDPGDDNGNGIVDETGLAFNADERQITVRLTLRRTDSRGTEYVRTTSRRITCRN
ncbi:MAG: hypothetical protein H6828_03155 [Planctomycetes bacterium]|nr:hypothetical protein [Planctomycetota bacterium]